MGYLNHCLRQQYRIQEFRQFTKNNGIYHVNGLAERAVQISQLSWQGSYSSTTSPHTLPRVYAQLWVNVPAPIWICYTQQ